MCANACSAAQGSFIFRIAIPVFEAGQLSRAGSRVPNGYAVAVPDPRDTSETPRLAYPLKPD